MTFILLATALAQPPTFEVRNLCPPAFTVTNKMPVAAPVVAATRTFQHNASHNCPTCGRVVTWKSGRFGTGHTHTCPVDGTTWWHN